jgi:hypothetical protein
VCLDSRVVLRDGPSYRNHASWYFGCPAS